MIGFVAHMAKPCNLALGDRRMISSNTLYRAGRAASLKVMSSKGAEHEVFTQKRRAVMFGVPALAFAPKPALAGLFNGKTPLQEAFELAIGLGQRDPTSAAADEAWGKAIKIAPDNAAAYSNRGTLRLQNGKYALAAEDLEKAAELEQIAYGYSSGFVRTALGNAQGAQGDWEAALENFELAQEDPYPGLKELGMYNHALAQFELGRSAEAVTEAKELLAISEEFTDLRGALVGFLWAQGEEDAAKGLAEQTGGMSVLRDLTVTQQAGKTWPPRTIAAVTAFINAERTGRALDYYDKPVEYTF